MTADKNHVKPKTQLRYPHVVVETNIDVLNKKLLDAIQKSPNLLDLSTALEETWLKYFSFSEEVERKLGTPRHAIQITDPHDQNQKKYVVMGEFFFTHYADGNNVLGFRLDGREYLHPFPDFPRFEHLVISVMTLGKSREFRVYRIPGESLGQELKHGEEIWVKVASELDRNLLGITTREVAQINRDNPNQMVLFGGNTNDVAHMPQVETLGLNFSTGQQKALFAVQKLFHKTRYLGNRPGLSVADDQYGYRGYLPLIEVKKSDYLDSYGVGKQKSPRGKMEYNKAEKELALKHLRELLNPVTILQWVPDGQGGAQYARKVSGAIIALLDESYKKLTAEELEILEQNKEPASKDYSLRILAGAPLMKALDNFFLQLPAGFLKEITEKKPRAGKYFTLFIRLLFNYATMNRDKKKITLKMGLSTLSEKMRMYPIIKTGQKTRARNIIKTACENAKEMDYLLDYHFEQGKSINEEMLVATINKKKVLPEA
jgi:hypothetical protein